MFAQPGCQLRPSIIANKVLVEIDPRAKMAQFGL
jgi:hypothetical protein